MHRQLRNLALLALFCLAAVALQASTADAWGVPEGKVDPKSALLLGSIALKKEEVVADVVAKADVFETKMGLIKKKGTDPLDTAERVVVQGNYPPAQDYSPGVCTGYAYCIPGSISPSFVPAVTTCPSGYNLDENGLCYQNQQYCVSGLKPDYDGKCCAERASQYCYASMEATCPFDQNKLGAICVGTQDYLDVYSQVTVDPITNLGPKEEASGKAYFNIYLPKFDLGKSGMLLGTEGTVEKKMVVLSKPLFGLTKMKIDKTTIVPKCFTKCCKGESDQMCVPAKIKKVIQQPTLKCPVGCNLPAGGKCVCGTGGPAPCPVGTRDCPTSGGRICVSEDLCFGVDTCKMATLLVPHLPAVGCPTSNYGGVRPSYGGQQSFTTKTTVTMDDIIARR